MWMIPKEPLWIVLFFQQPLCSGTRHTILIIKVESNQSRQPMCPSQQMYGCSKGLLVEITTLHGGENNPQMCVKEREQAVGSGYDGKWEMENASSFVYSNKGIEI